MVLSGRAKAHHIEAHQKGSFKHFFEKRNKKHKHTKTGTVQLQTRDRRDSVVAVPVPLASIFSGGTLIE